MIFREVDGETLVLDRARGLLHQFNRTASYIWDQCNGRTTTGEIANQIAEAFGVDLEIAAVDVVAVVEQLQSLSLLEAA